MLGANYEGVVDRGCAGLIGEGGRSEEGASLSRSPRGKGLKEFNLCGENWTCFKGMFREGVKDGFGKFEFWDGKEFETEFVGDRAQGYGVVRFKDGRKMAGEWANDLLISVL